VATCEAGACLVRAAEDELLRSILRQHVPRLPLYFRKQPRARPARANVLRGQTPCTRIFGRQTARPALCSYYLVLAAGSLAAKVITPLVRYGIDPRPHLGGELDALLPSSGALPNDEASVA
jgi:hypothetical protein